eukprot:scaffold101747_cov34-Phaeocystis_antarctica.AAC.1
MALAHSCTPGYWERCTLRKRRLRLTTFTRSLHDLYPSKKGLASNDKRKMKELQFQFSGATMKLLAVRGRRRRCGREAPRLVADPGNSTAARLHRGCPEEKDDVLSRPPPERAGACGRSPNNPMRCWRSGVDWSKLRLPLGVAAFSGVPVAATARAPEPGREHCTSSCTNSLSSSPRSIEHVVACEMGCCGSKAKEPSNSSLKRTGG